MGDCDTAERMGDDHDGPGRGIDRRENARDPGVAPRCVPIVLLDAARGRKIGLPARLPMVGSGIAEAGNDENICVGGAHRCLRRNIPLHVITLA